MIGRRKLVNKTNTMNPMEELLNSNFELLSEEQLDEKIAFVDKQIKILEDIKNRLNNTKFKNTDNKNNEENTLINPNTTEIEANETNTNKSTTKDIDTFINEDINTHISKIIMKIDSSHVIDPLYKILPSNNRENEIIIDIKNIPTAHIRTSEAGDIIGMKLLSKRNGKLKETLNIRLEKKDTYYSGKIVGILNF